MGKTSWLARNTEGNALCRREHYRFGQGRLLLSMMFFLFVWVNTLGEDAMKKPFIALLLLFLGNRAAIWTILEEYIQK